MEEILHQLIDGKHPIIYRVSTILLVQDFAGPSTGFHILQRLKGLPNGNSTLCELEAMAIEIVDLIIENGDFPYVVIC